MTLAGRRVGLLARGAGLFLLVGVFLLVADWVPNMGQIRREDLQARVGRLVIGDTHLAFPAGLARVPVNGR